MFTVYHNSPHDTLSIDTDDAKALAELLERARKHLTRLASAYDDEHWETIEELEDVVGNLNEYTQ